MKSFLKILYVFVVFCLVFLGSTAFALEGNGNIGVSTERPFSSKIGLYGTDRPSKNDVWDWNDGNYTISGHNSYSVLYSSKVFTGTSQLHLTLTKNDYTTTYELWRIDLHWPHEMRTNKKVATTELDRLTAGDISNGKTRSHYFKNLDPSKKYFIAIIAPSYFTGTISTK